MGYQPHFDACSSTVYIQLRCDVFYCRSGVVIPCLHTYMYLHSYRLQVGEVFNKWTTVPYLTTNNIHDTPTYATKELYLLAVTVSIVRLRATNECMILPYASNTAGLGLGYITASLSSNLNLERRLQSWTTGTRHRHHCS
jgi:hypothetical protein